MEPTDIELMLSVKGGDVAAFRELVRRYREPLRRFFTALLANRSEADDCVQETFLRLWLLRGRYAPTGRFSTYLFQIGKHYLLNHRSRYRPPPVVENDVCCGDDVRRAPEQRLLERDRQGRIRAAIAALPPHYRAVFEMSHFEGMKYAEIACRLGIPVGTVKSRMAEAVRRLRTALADELEGG